MAILEKFAMRKFITLLATIYCQPLLAIDIDDVQSQLCEIARTYVYVVLSPMKFMGRLAALVPRPRVNLTRFHGVFSGGGLPPNSKLREYVVPQKPIEE
jgi:hypothetical protein